MGQFGKVGRVDSKLEFPINRIKKKLYNIGIEGVSDRQATKVLADVFENIEFDIKIKSKKRRDKFEITFR